MKKAVNTFLIREKDGIKEVCLGMKKTGHGKGKWNGFGGKVEEGETFEAAAIREVSEEVEVDIKEDDLEFVGHVLYRA